METAEVKIRRAKFKLMRSSKFALMSGMLLVGKSSIVDGFPTAATDGYNDWYGREFIDKLDQKMVNYVVLHETHHKAFRHMSTWKHLFKQHPHHANAAADFVINLLAHDLDPTGEVIARPKIDGQEIGLFDEKYRGMDTYQVYKDLLKQYPPIKIIIMRGDGSQGEGDDPSNVPGGFDEHEWEGGEGLSESEKREIEREIDRAVRQGQMLHKKLHGGNPGDLSRELEELLVPKIDWAKELREFVVQVCTAGRDVSSWRRPNRRFLHSGIYMPTLIGNRVGRIVVGVDTSGSIGTEELTRFISETVSIAEILQPEKIDLLYWDGHVAKHEEYGPGEYENMRSSTRPRGGGCTSPACVEQYLLKHKIEPQCVVMLTDGYVDGWGNNWPAPVLWAITGDGIQAPVGKSLHLDI